MEDAMKDAIIELLKWCAYREDVRALAHFVFHARLNNCSNLCLLCLQGAEEAIDGDVDGEDGDHGHAVDCPYLLAAMRVRGNSLAAYIERA